MTVSRLVLIRTGETDWNRQGRWQGWVANPLNDHGKQQVRALANYIRHIGMGVLYTSDLRRAVETAEHLTAKLDFNAVLDSRWRERDIGRWQGMTLAEIRAWYPDQFQALQADPHEFRVPGGESRADVRRRVLFALDDALALEGVETVGVITHSTAIRALLDALVPNHNLSGVVIGNSSVTTLARDGSVWHLVAANDLAHLEGLASASVAELESER